MIEGKMWAVYGLSLLIVLLAAGWTVVCRQEYRDHAKLSVKSAVAVWILYGLHAGLAAFVAWQGVWPLPVAPAVSVPLGVLFVLFGMVVFAAGVATFGSLRRMSGLETNALISSGIYGWSRNPQNLGWELFLVGVALLGRSGFALALVGLFGMVFHVYLVAVEEPYLEQVFGEAYRRYRLNTPRYMGTRTHHCE